MEVEIIGENEIKIDIQSCPICLEEIVIPCKTQCDHTMCKECIEAWFKKKKDTCLNLI